MSQPLILVAASGLAREVLEAVRAQGRYTAIGCVDDSPAQWGELVDGVKVLGGLDVVREYPNATIMICAGKGAARQAIASRLDLDDSRYATVVHPAASLGRTCKVGPGSLLLAGCVLTASVMLGRYVVAMPRVVLTHDDVIEDGATLCAGVTLGGSVTIGAGAYLGMQACVRERCRVAPDAIIGMGSVVTTDIPPAETWVGNPARPIRSTTHRQQA